MLRLMGLAGALGLILCVCGPIPAQEAPRPAAAGPAEVSDLNPGGAAPAIAVAEGIGPGNVLRIRFVAVTPGNAADAGLEPLKALSKVRYIQLSTRVTRAGGEALQAALPDCRVWYPGAPDMPNLDDPWNPGDPIKPTVPQAPPAAPAVAAPAPAASPGG